MRLAVLLVAPVLSAQASLDLGADVFAKTCATGYCHGANGAGGGAPKLAGRGFDEAYITSVTRAGVAGTAMQGYGTILARPEFNAVVAYVAKLNGIEPHFAGPATRALTPEASRGRDLFFNPLRGFARCSTCHQVDGLGIAVAPITKIPASPSALREVAALQVRSATVEGERFPALLVSQGGRRTALFDLTTLPPVLRTVDSNALKIGSGNWRHAAMLTPYSEMELRDILAFLRASADR